MAAAGAVCRLGPVGQGESGDSDGCVKPSSVFDDGHGAGNGDGGDRVGAGHRVPPGRFLVHALGFGRVVSVPRGFDAPALRRSSLAMSDANSVLSAVRSALCLVGMGERDHEGAAFPRLGRGQHRGERTDHRSLGR